jgi:hypothetical protein
VEQKGFEFLVKALLVPARNCEGNWGKLQSTGNIQDHQKPDCASDHVTILGVLSVGDTLQPFEELKTGVTAQKLHQRNNKYSFVNFISSYYTRFSAIVC